MWLSDSDQTAAILAATNTATRSQVTGARLTARLSSERHAAANTKGATHQTSKGRSSRMIAVSVRTESGTPCSSRTGRRSRVHTVDELACQTSGRRQAVRRVLDPPGLDTDHVHGTSMSALAFDDPAREPRQLGVARQQGGTPSRILERRRNGDLL